MAQHTHPTLPDDLRGRLEQVARHWRRRRLFRSAVRWALATLALAAACTALLAWAAPTPWLQGLWLVLFVVLETAAAWRWLARPLRAPVDLREAAVLIDRLYPDLENRILSAVELSEKDVQGASSWMIEQFLREAQIASYRSSFTPLIHPGAVGVPLAGALILGLAAGALIIGFHVLWTPLFLFGSEQSPTIARVDFLVLPGNTRVRTGESVVVQTRSKDLRGRTEIQWSEDEGGWREAPMEAAAVEGVHYHQFQDIQRPLSYRAKVGDSISPVYRIGVWTPPRVEAVDLHYEYPEYLGLPPRDTPNGGDITAIEGTRVDLEVSVNKPLDEALMTLSDGSEVTLVQSREDIWSGSLVITRNDTYSIALTDPDGDTNEYKTEYKIVAQTDKPPQIKIDFPRQDIEATSIEDIPFTFEASDDFGLSDFGIQYETAGGEPQRIVLANAESEPLKAKGDYTLRLEDLDLTPGDLVTWTVWAEDRKPERSPYETLDDPYFVEVRPFRRLYREAVSNEGQSQDRNANSGQQGGGGGAQASSEKEIVIAIWNLRRDYPLLKPDEYLKRRTDIMDAQSDMIQGANSEAGAIMGGPSPEALKEMDSVVRALDGADLPDPTDELTEAARHAKNAYQQMLRDQPDEAQVAQRRANSANGSRSGQTRDIRQLEMRRNRNFYEEERRTSQEQQQAAEEARTDIKELAQRQQMVNEEINKLISEMQNATTEKERRELERRLESLRQQQREAMERLDQADQQIASSAMDSQQASQSRDSLQDARQNMNRSLQGMDQNQLQEARSAGARAQSSLQDLEQELRQLSRAGAEQRMNELRQDMQELVENQDSILERLRALREEQDASRQLRTPESLKNDSQSLMDEKTSQGEEFTKFMEQASDLAAGMSGAQELASRALNDWLRETSREGLLEDFEQGRELMDYGLLDPAVDQEQSTRNKMAEAAAGLDEIANMLVADDLEGMQRALDQLRRLRENETNPDQTVAGQGPDEENRQQVASARPGLQESLSGQSQNGATDEQGQQSQQEGQQGQQDRQGQQGQQGEQSQPEGQQQGQQGQEGQRGEQSQPEGQLGQQGQQSPRPRQQGQQGQGSPSDQQAQAQSGGRGQNAENPPGNNQQGAGGQQDRPTGDPNTQNQPGGRGGARNGGERAFGGGFGADWSFWTNARTPDELRQFVERDYADYVDRLRNAEALLPPDSDYRRELENVRETIESMRRDYRRNFLTPKYDLYLQAVGGPLAKTASDLQEEIERRLHEKDLIVREEGEIPDQYRKQVADYFETLSGEEDRSAP